MLWLVIHGDRIWQAALVVAVVAALVSVRQRTHRRAARRAREQLEDLDEPTDRLDEGDEVVIEGILRAHEQEGGAPLPTGTRVTTNLDEDPEGIVLSLETTAAGGDTIEIVDATYPWSGSTEHWPETAPGDPDESVHRSIAVGDRVRAAGRLRSEATSTGHYRGRAAARWFLSAQDGETYVSLTFVGRPRVQGPGWKSFAWAVAAAGISFALVGFFFGAVAFEIAQQLQYRWPAAVDARLNVAAITAASPFHRSEATDLYVRSVLPLDPERLKHGDRAIEIERRLHGTCTSTLRAMIDAGYAARVSAVASACNSDSAVHERLRAALFAGDLENAHRLIETMPSARPNAWLASALHLLVTDHEAAAGSIRRLAAGEDTPDRRSGLECIALGLDVHRGAADADALDERSKSAHGEICKLLFWGTLDPWVRSIVMDDRDFDFRLQPVRDLLATEAHTDLGERTPPPFDFPTDVAAGRVVADTLRLGLLGKAVVGVKGKKLVPDYAVTVAAHHQGLGVALVRMGDVDAGRRHLRDAEAYLRRAAEEQGTDFADGDALASLSAIRAAAELRAGNVESARRLLAKVARAGLGDPAVVDLAQSVAYVERGVVPPEGERTRGVGWAGLEIAREPGSPFVRWLKRQPRDVAVATAFLAAHRPETDREALREWLARDTVDELCSSPNRCRLEALAADAATRALAARLVDDAPLAESLSNRANRLRTALLRTDLALERELLDVFRRTAAAAGWP